MASSSHIALEPDTTEPLSWPSEVEKILSNYPGVVSAELNYEGTKAEVWYFSPQSIQHAVINNTIIQFRRVQGLTTVVSVILGNCRME